MRCTKAIHCGAVLGCALAVPTRSALVACCAWPANGHAATPPIAPRNCRRLMTASKSIERILAQFGFTRRWASRSAQLRSGTMGWFGANVIVFVLNNSGYLVVRPLG